MQQRLTLSRRTSPRWRASFVPFLALKRRGTRLFRSVIALPSTTEQAAVVWCVLNRVDDPRFPDTVLEVIEAPYQFSGYDPEYPVKEEFALLAADVLTRYRAERDGEENVGRVLPAEYCFFTGDGRRNHFTTEWKSTDCFGWTLESPYTD